MSAPFLLAQLSDLHVAAEGKLCMGRIDTAAMLAACVGHLRAFKHRPHAVVLSGDLVDLGSAPEYARLRELLAPLAMPVYLMPGNHDVRERLRAAFPEHAYLRQSPEFIQYVIDDYPLRIVALDTVIPGKGTGELCGRRIEWLDRTLAREPQKPTVVLMHHPPFATLIDYMDRFPARDRDALAAVIGRHPQVQSILCGHVHRPIETRFAGTLASTSPSIAHQVALDLEDDAPLRYTMEPPAYRLHAYTPESGLVSHTVYVGEFR